MAENKAPGAAAGSPLALEAPRLRRLIADMQQASTLCDDADGPQEYQTRLIALAMIARQYLRAVAEGAARRDVQPADE